MRIYLYKSTELPLNPLVTLPAYCGEHWRVKDIAKDASAPYHYLVPDHGRPWQVANSGPTVVFVEQIGVAVDGLSELLNAATQAINADGVAGGWYEVDLVRGVWGRSRTQLAGVKLGCRGWDAPAQGEEVIDNQISVIQSPGCTIWTDLVLDVSVRLLHTEE